VGKNAADLLTLSGYVRGCLSGAATIVTQLVTHLRLATEVITCLQIAVSSCGSRSELRRELPAGDRGIPWRASVNGTAMAR